MKKTSEEIKVAYEHLSNEIKKRRHWLLWHNKEFRTELKILTDKTDPELLPLYFNWYTLMYPIFKRDYFMKDDPDWQKFYAKYGIGYFLPEGKIISKQGEKPFCFKFIGNDNRIDYIRLIIWPGETNFKLIQDMWDYVQVYMSKYEYTKTNISWSLNNKNFWRDAHWYKLKWKDAHWLGRNELGPLIKPDSLTYKNDYFTKWHTGKHNLKGKKLIDAIIIETKETMPIGLDKMYMNYLIKNHKLIEASSILDIADPEHKIREKIKKQLISKYDGINLLLYNFGIYLIASPSEEWKRNFPYYYIPFKEFTIELISDSLLEIKKQGNFLLRYNQAESISDTFTLVISDRERNNAVQKRNGRELFERARDAHYLSDKAMTEGRHAVEQAISSMQKKIDNMR